MGSIPTRAVMSREAAWWDADREYVSDKDRLLTTQEALTEAGLNYKFEKRNMIDVSGLDVENAQHVVRLARPGFDEPEYSIGVVGNRYDIVQPDEIADYMGAMLGQLKDDGYVITSAFELEHGKRIAFVAQTEDLLVNGNDPVARYLVGSTANDGSGSTRFDETDVRAVCENTLMMGFRSAKRTLKFRHTVGANERLRDAAKLARETRLYNAMFEEYTKRMLDIELSVAEIDDVIANLIVGTSDKDGKLSTRAENQRKDAFENIAETGTIANDLKHTAWGVWQGLTEWDQHGRSERDTGRDRTALLFNKRIFGTSAKFSEDAFSLLTTNIDEDDVKKAATSKLKLERILK